MSTVKQVWQCPKCERTYDSPISVSEAVCTGVNRISHVPKVMVLIEGEPLPKRRKGRK